MSRCIYDEAATDAVRIDEDGRETPADVRLCFWAVYSHDAIKLVDVPIWIQRTATSGALMNEGDCEKCTARRDS